MRFATVRIGKTSVNDIKKMNTLTPGVLTVPYNIPVVCTQLPLDLEPGTIVFVWFGSDNSKGMPTEWKQGFKVVGVVTDIQRGPSFNSDSTTYIDVEYVFNEAINRIDILRDASSAYYSCANLPVIGIDDHSNQTIRLFDNGQDLCDPNAFLFALNKVRQGFKEDICRIHPELLDHFSYFDARLNSVVGDQSKSIPPSLTYDKYLRALRTKPFMLLAGISGTGKSRIVRELAFKSCPEYLRDADGTTPGNYLMVEVKPNWHDSSELLGYYSHLANNGNGGYVFTPFTKFFVKAMMFPNVPFFVCLDEMNLAPVEQYFAEFLSVLETRKHDIQNNIQTGVLVKPEYFQGISDHVGDGYICKTFFPDGLPQIDYLTYTGITLTTKGLSLPDNVFIIGTVNMDDTTHQFSRKVIDRAMTIEMNGGKLTDMFGHSSDLEYLPADQVWELEKFLPQYVNADEVVAAHPEYEWLIQTQLPAILEDINDVLRDTPFQVSYRVLNEMVIYFSVLVESGMPSEEAKNMAVDQMLLMKILPRIEGDRDMLMLDAQTCRLDKLEPFAASEDTKKKIAEMKNRLNKQEFTRFWP